MQLFEHFSHSAGGFLRSRNADLQRIQAQGWVPDVLGTAPGENVEGQDKRLSQLELENIVSLKIRSR